MKFRKKPVVIEAKQWVGGDYGWLDHFYGKNWGRADAVGYCQAVDVEGVVVFNTAEQAWIHVPVNHWIIKGISGELYPCAPDIFQKTYDILEDQP